MTEIKCKVSYLHVMFFFIENCTKGTKVLPNQTSLISTYSVLPVSTDS